MLFEDFHTLIVRFVVVDRIDADGIDKEVFHERSIEFALFRYRERIIGPFLKGPSVDHAYMMRLVSVSSAFRATDLTSDEELFS